MKKINKIIICIFLIAICLVSMISCTNKKEETISTQNSSVTEESIEESTEVDKLTTLEKDGVLKVVYLGATQVEIDTRYSTKELFSPYYLSSGTGCYRFSYNQTEKVTISEQYYYKQPDTIKYKFLEDLSIYIEVYYNYSKTIDSEALFSNKETFLFKDYLNIRITEKEYTKIE